MSAYDLLVIDDFGLMELDLDKCRDLFEIIETRDSRKATMIVSQLPVAKWWDLFEYGALLEPLASVTIEPLKSVRQSHKNREILCQNGRRLPGAHTQKQSSSFFGLSESPLKIIL
jgi:DNA replication protein DnaC